MLDVEEILDALGLKAHENNLATHAAAPAESLSKDASASEVEVRASIENFLQNVFPTSLS